jgi:hypothetical protein
MCGIRLASHQVLSVHAHLRRDARRWLIRALDREHGIAQNGARCEAFSLEAGVEIGLGGMTLIAETARSMALRAFCARLLGWDASRATTIDLALRSIRSARAHRSALWLCGDTDLVPIAHSLHRRAIGEAQPFVVCDPRRRNGRESVRSAANHELGAGAVRAAAGGSICLRSSRLPRDVSIVMALVRDPNARAQVIVCSTKRDVHADLLTVPIEVPRLSQRAADLPRIIDEYAYDAIARLNVPPERFTPTDRQWILDHAATSLSEIEKATMRFAAIRASSTLSRAARHLGMAHVSLSRWLGRRRPPAEVG